MVRNAFVLSDIHLGASTGLLTAIDRNPQDETLFDRPLAEAVLGLLLADLRQAVGEGGTVEQCILLGDIFDFSFAPYGLAMQNGNWFFQRLVDSGLFESFVFVPGNHDHHLWQQIIEDNYMIRALDNPPVNYPKTLPSTETLDDTFLNRMLPEGHRLHVTYPNYQIVINGQVIFLHHGHYLQKLYSVASKLLAETIETEDIEDLEALNSPFLEFGWYYICQAYNLGQQKLIDRLYFMMKNHHTKQLDKVLSMFLSRIDQWEPKSNRRSWDLIGHTTDWLIKHIGPFVIKRLFFKHSKLFRKGRHASSVRHKRLHGPLQQAALDYITKYLLPEQNRQKEYTFIFGHTHEVEQNVLCTDGQGICYHLYNTGGWIVDQLDERGRFIIPQIAPIYLAEDGSVNPIPFSQRHEAFLQERIQSDAQMQKVKEQQMLP